ncbi:MAG TPA: CbtA family protein [Candidatus Binataceae bacterium]|nr:CbtA family protein [Candidatus Binataceae bacterium]
MLSRTLFCAVVAGVLAGIILFALQHWTTLPLINQAERYEKTETAAHPAMQANDAPEVGRAGEQEVGPKVAQTDVVSAAYTRAAYTAVGDVLVATGFGMLLAAMHALSGKFGLVRGIVWGLAGFATFHLGPALVVPPLLPALDGAPLHLRQSAWLVAAISTGLGLAIFAFGSRGAKLAGVVALCLPVVLFRYLFPFPGAQAPSEALSVLEDLFIVRTLGDNLIFWLVLGAISGAISGRTFEQSAVPDAGRNGQRRTATNGSPTLLSYERKEPSTEAGCRMARGPNVFAI